MVLLNRIIYDIKTTGDALVNDENDNRIYYREYRRRSRRIGLRRTTEQDRLLPLLLTLDPVLFLRVRLVFDTLPDFIFLYLCILILGYLLQCTVDEDVLLLELNEAKREIGIELARSSARAFLEVSSSSSWIALQ
jgi:hypothetical protein